MLFPAFILPAFRIGVACALAPLFWPGRVPWSARAAVALMLAAALAPLQLPTLDTLDGLTGGVDEGSVLWGALFMEGLIGASLGMVAGCLVAGLEAAGTLMGSQLGAQSWSPLASSHQHQDRTMGTFTGLLGIGLFWSLGGHRIFLEALIHSFRVWPPGEVPPVTDAPMVDGLAMAGGQVLVVSLGLALPVAACRVIADLTGAMVSRVGPLWVQHLVAVPPIRLLVTMGAILVVLALLTGDVMGIGVGWMERLLGYMMGSVREAVP